MNIGDIMTLDVKKRIDLLTKDISPHERETHYQKWQDEYDGKHEILRKKDKDIGDPATGSVQTVKTAKEVVTLQKKIVRTAVWFLLGEPATLILNNEGDKYDKAFSLITETWKRNRLDDFNKALMRRVSIETAAAELWHITGDRVDTGKKTPEGNPVYRLENKRLRVILLSRQDGYYIYPHFDEYGDLDAYTVKYDVERLENDQPKKYPHVDIYTAETIYHYVKTGTEWTETTEPNLFGKIPVIHYEQEAPEWADVQHLIDRLENKMSSHADTNDYFDSPVLKVKGKVASLPDKTEDGKVIVLEGEPGVDGRLEYGDADYITWSQSPESMKLEYEMLKYFILYLTDTPDIGFDNMKTLGALSGAAIRLMFLAAEGKARYKQEIFGTGFARRINLLKAMLSTAFVGEAANLDELDIEVAFNSALPENVGEILENLSIATGAKPTISRETAVRQNPLVDDPGEELTRIEKEEQQTIAAAQSFEL